MAKVKKVKQTDPLAGIRLDDLYKDDPEELEKLKRLEQSSTLKKSREAFNLKASYGLGITDVPQHPDYGESRYDAPYPTLAQYNDYQEERALNQPGWSQLANGILKGAITTGTTMVNTLAGLPFGMLEAAANGDISKIWDNEITNAMSNVDEWAEKELPNYYTDAELNDPWYTNIFTANFFGDKLIKNFGFTLGAGAAGKVISKVPKLLPKLATKAATLAGRTEKDVAAIGRAANAFGTSFVSAVGEGSIEALQATKEWSAAMTNQINQEQALQLQALQQEYETNLALIQQQYGNTEVGQQIAMSYQQEMQQKIAAIENETNRKMAQVASQRAQTGNAVLAFNLPILTMGNLMTLGKVFAKGYTAEMSSIDRHILFHPEDLANAGKTVTETTKGLTWRGLRDKTKEVTKQAFTSDLSVGKNVAKTTGSALWEGTEEMLQGWASNASKSYNTDYYNQSVDPDYTDKTASMWKSLGDSFVDTFGNIANWEEFAIGMLSGGISNMILGQTGEMRRERLAVNEAVNKLNDAVNTFSNRELIKGLNRHQYLEDLKTHAAVENREKEYKDADFAQLASDVVLFGSLGKLDELKAIVDYNLENLSNDELDKLAEDLSQKETNGPENNLFVKLDTAGKRKYLKDQQEKYHQIIDDYNNERSELTALTGNLFSQEQMSELVYERLRTKNSSKRAEEVKQDLKNQINQALEQQTSDQAYHTRRLDLHKNILSSMRNQLTKWNRELVDLIKQESLLRGKIGVTREYAERNKEILRRDLDIAYENLYSADAYNEQLIARRPTTHKSRNQRQLEVSQKRITQLEKQINRYQGILNEYEEGTGSKQRTRLDNLVKIYFEQIDTTTKTSNLRGRAREEQAQIKLLQRLLNLNDTAIEGYNTALEFIAKNLDTIFDVNSKELYAGNVKEAFMSTLGLGMILSSITSDSIENQKIMTGVTDITTLLADALNYNNRVSEFLQNPQKLEEKNNGIKERVLNKRLEKKADEAEEALINAENFQEFSQILESLDPRVKIKVLQRLKDKNNHFAEEYEEKYRDIQLVFDFIDSSDVELNIKNIAKSIFLSAVNTVPTKDLLSIDTPFYSRENNQQLDDETYVKVKTLLAQAFNYQEQETSEPSTPDPTNAQEKPVTKNPVNAVPDSEEIPTIDQDEIDAIAQALAERSTGATESNSSEESRQTISFEEEPISGAQGPIPTASVVEATTDTHGFTSDNSGKNLSPINLKDNNLTSTKELELDSAPVELPTPEIPQTKGRAAVGMSDVDTKAGSSNYGKPVTEEIDEQGNPTNYAKNSQILYNRLKDLGAFDNLRNGVAQKNSKVQFAIWPSLDREIKEKNGYDGTTVLLYIDGKCVGHLPTANAESAGAKLGIANLLKEEFKGKLNTEDVLISNKYYTTVEEMWSGIIVYNEDNSYKTVTSDDLAWIRNRLNSSSSNITESDKTPLLTIFDGNIGFVKDGSTVFRYGTEIAPVYLKNKPYKGAPVLLVPSGAYDRNKPNTQQANNAYIPVMLRRTKFEELDKTTETYGIIENLIGKLFKGKNDNGIVRGLKISEINEVIGNLKSELTYEYNTSKGKQQIFIVPSRQSSSDPNKIVPIDPKGYTETTTKYEDLTPTHLTIQLKLNNGLVKSYTFGIAQGNVYQTTILQKDIADSNKERLLDFFLKEADAYVNIDKNKLNKSEYVDRVFEDGLVKTNATELKTKGASFAMVNEVMVEGVTKPNQTQEEETTQPESTESTETTQPEESAEAAQEAQETQEEYHNPLMDLLGSDFNSTDQPETSNDAKYSRVGNETKLATINIEKEVDNICRMLPQLDRKSAFEIVNDLININDKGDKAQGVFNKGLMTISKLAEAGTGYHEAFHLVFNMLLTNKEKSALMAEYKSNYPNYSDLELEEQMADDFKEYSLLRETNQPTTFFERLGKSIINAFKRLFNHLNLYKNHPTVFQTVSANIWQGKYAERQLKPTDAVRDSKEEYTQEMQQIKDQAIANGTFMKAPNGKPTNLTERQWLQVRTKAFKDWFGDWEKHNKTNPYNADVEIVGPFENYDASDVNGIGVGFALKYNGEIIGDIPINAYFRKNGIEPWGENEQGIISASSVGLDINLDTEYRGKGLGKAMYFAFAQKMADLGYTFASSVLGNTSEDAKRVWDSLVKDGYAYKKNDRYYINNSSLTNASKVVDENGEPLVVYHSGEKNWTYNIFEKQKGYKANDFFYFSSDKNTALTYQKWNIDYIKRLYDNSPSKSIIYETLYFRESIKDENGKFIKNRTLSREEVDNLPIIEVYDELHDVYGKKVANAIIDINNKKYLNPSIEALLSIADTIDYVYDKEELIKYLNIIKEIKSKSSIDEVLTTAAFLNIRYNDSVTLDAEGNNWHEYDMYLGRKYDFNPEYYVYELNKNANGFIIENIKDSSSENDKRIGLSTTYAVKHSNQIKSATDNVGTFSRENDDIRYSLPLTTKIAKSNLSTEEYNELRSLSDKINTKYRIGRNKNSFAIQFREENGRYAFRLTQNYEHKIVNGVEVNIPHLDITKKVVDKYLKDNNLTNKYKVVQIDNSYELVIDDEIPIITREVVVDETNTDDDNKAIYDRIIAKQRRGYTLTEEEEMFIQEYSDIFETKKYCYIG